jgi:hypothetical protein
MRGRLFAHSFRDRIQIHLEIHGTQTWDSCLLFQNYISHLPLLTEVEHSFRSGRDKLSTCGYFASSLFLVRRTIIVQNVCWSNSWILDEVYEDIFLWTTLLNNFLPTAYSAAQNPLTSEWSQKSSLSTRSPSDEAGTTVYQGTCHSELCPLVSWSTGRWKLSLEREIKESCLNNFYL